MRNVVVDDVVVVDVVVVDDELSSFVTSDQSRSKKSV